MINRANNFDALRFWAAMAVLWSHAFSVTVGQAYWEPLNAASGGQTTMGTVAVSVFFVISGYLITQSFERSRSAWRFAKARILRLVPAFWIVLLLLGLAVGPIVTRLPLTEYFSDPQLWRYIVLNGSFLGYTGELPGVFVDNPLDAANGSLWTLRFEAECYVLVFVLGILGLLNRYVTLAFFCGGLAYLAIDGPYLIADFGSWNHRVNLATSFLAGAVIYHWQPRLDGAAAGICAAVSLLALLLGGFWLAVPTVFAYLVIYLALGPLRMPDMARYGDLSYGIYIYAWPVKQLVIHYGLATTWYGVAGFATAITLGLAFLSWHLVEKRALACKDRRLPGERHVSYWVDTCVTALRLSASPPSPRPRE